MIFVIPAVCLSVGLAVGWLCLFNRWAGAVWALAVVLGGGAGWALVMGRAAQGWDGIGYAIALTLGFLPALLGLLLGALIGRWRRIKAEVGTGAP